MDKKRHVRRFTSNLVTMLRLSGLQKKPPIGVFRKRCSEYMLQIYRRPPKAKQLYWNYTSAWLLSCKLLHSFQTLFIRTPLVCCFRGYTFFDAQHFKTCLNFFGTFFIQHLDYAYLFYIPILYIYFAYLFTTYTHLSKTSLQN